MMFSALKVSKNCLKIKPFCELKLGGSVNMVCIITLSLQI